MTLRAVGFLALVSIVSTTSVVAQKSTVGSAQIVERCGAFGTLRIGALPPADAKLVNRQTKSSVFSLKDGTQLDVGEDGRIWRIHTNKRGVFTQRYVVIGQSTFDDVVDRYGEPVRNSGPTAKVFTISYPYDGITFIMFLEKGASKVTGILVDAQEQDPSGADHPCPLRQ